MNDYRAYIAYDYNSIYHHGIKGQRWGIMNGPPYPLNREDHSVREQVAASNPNSYEYTRRRTKQNTRAKYNYESTKTSNQNGSSKKGGSSKVLSTKASAVRTSSGGGKGIKGFFNRHKGVRNALIASTAVLGAYAAYKVGRTWYTKTHDLNVKAGTAMNTLSFDNTRMKQVKDAKDLSSAAFFTNANKDDYRFYQYMFNPEIKQGNRTVLKYNAKNIALRDLKMASEKTSANEFIKMYKSDKTFREYVTNPELMNTTMFDKQRKMKTYANALNTTARIRSRKNLEASDKELRDIYKLYNLHLGAAPGTNNVFSKSVSKEAAENYIKSKNKSGHVYKLISNDDGTFNVQNETLTNYMTKYRNEYFGRLKKRGYSGLLDTNDALYGRYHANNPFIVFDNSSFVTKSNKRVKMSEKKFATAWTIGRYALPVVGSVGAGAAAYRATNRTVNRTTIRQRQNGRTQTYINNTRSRARALYNSGMTQEQIARKLGVSVSTVNNMLNG